MIMRRLRRNKHITTHKVRAISKSQDNRRSRALQGSSTKIGGKQTDVERHLTESAEGDEELSEVADRSLLVGDVNSPADY